MTLSGALSGGLLVVVITVLAGVIAYIGDRVGHQVGRKRLTLFGLRPRYTSTIVAVGTGMLIALSVTVIAIVASNLVRTAFFRLGQINAQISALEAQQLALKKEIETTRDTSIIVPLGTPIPGVLPLIINPAQSDAVLLPELSRLFEQTATVINRDFPTSRYPLRPYTHTSTEAVIQRKLREELAGVRNNVASRRVPPDTPVLLVPAISQNLFRGDDLTFTFAATIDLRVAAANETLASIPIQGGTPVNLQVLQQLSNDATVEVARRGMPPAYAASVGVNGPQAQAALAEIPRLHGAYRLVAKSTIDLYPHSGGVLLDIALVPAS